MKGILGFIPVFDGTPVIFDAMPPEAPTPTPTPTPEFSADFSTDFKVS